MPGQILSIKSKMGKIGIVGSGLIGRSWAMLFASAGYKVIVYDVDASQITSALGNIQTQLKELENAGLLRGSLSVDEQFKLISGTNSLAECVVDTKYVQECIPENLEKKRTLFAELDLLVSEKTILASSTSSMPASTFSESLSHRSQVIVAHPVNPPFYCPLTEVVPAPYTEQWVKDETVKILKEIGQTPVLLKKEIVGFALNRVQYALLSECWRLIEDDAISVEDLDKVMSDGLGMRYAFMGPLETCHLNAEGFANYCDRYGGMIYDIVSSFGPHPRPGGATADEIAKDLEQRVPLEKLVERRQWRDTRLAALAKLKRNVDGSH